MNVHARVVFGGVLYFVLAVALLHVLRPDVDPLARVTSEYAVGPYAPVMTLAYFALALAFGALALGFRRALAAPARAPGVALLFCAALGAAAAALFPVDVGVARPVTPSGWAHRIAAILAFGSMSLAPLFLARRLRDRPEWRGVVRLGTLAGAVGLVGFVAMQALLLERGLGGAAQRVVLAPIVAWVVAAAARLRASEAVSPQPVHASS